MTIHLYKTMQPLAADGRALIRILHVAGVEKDHLIHVVGPSGPLAALWLSHHGYDGAVFVRATAGERTRPADALVVPHPCAAEQLALLLDVAGAVREDGALIVQTRASRLGEEFGAVAALLDSRGFGAQRRMDDKGRPICGARRVGCPSADKAA
jgi:hypothetical protein